MTGLTTAIRLAEKGHSVRVFADAYLSSTTSWIATAIWHVFWVSVTDRVVGWAADSLAELLRLSELPETGVTRVRGIECLRESAPQADLVSSDVANFWREIVPYYESLSRDEVISRLPDDYPTETISGGYVIEVPIADMSIYMPYLHRRLDSLGVPLHHLHVATLDEFRQRVSSDVYVNCTGLGARELLNDTALRAVKGQIVRVSKGNISQYIADDFSPRGMTYILPRQNDIILGGSEDAGVDDSSVDLAFGAEIIDRCTSLMPELQEHEVYEHMAGLRPYRRGAIRLERDEIASDTIHNYGHGGSGVSLSWGCADEVAGLVEQTPFRSRR